MKPTHTSPRGSMVRINPAPVPRPQDSTHLGGRPDAGRGDGRACAAATRPVGGLAARAAGGPGSARPLDLFPGHFGTHTRGTGVEHDVNLLSLTHGDPDNHGAAPRAAQVRSRRLRRFARDLAQRPDGRRAAGLPGWAYRVGHPAAATRRRRSVTRYGSLATGTAAGAGPARPDLPATAQPVGPLPLRRSKRGRQPAALEAVPREGLEAHHSPRKGGGHA